MNNPNVLGYVTEVEENRDVKPVYDELEPTKVVELIPGETKVRLKLKLVNTLGRVREVWVDGPPDIVDFYSSDLPQELLDRAAKLEPDQGGTRIEV